MIFLDTETTGLDSGCHEIWEFALYDTRWGWTWSQIQLSGEALRYADTEALAISGYHERYGRHDGGRRPQMYGREAAVGFLAYTLEGQSLAGIGPWFDDRFLRALFERHGFVPSWEHRLVDVKTLAEGFLWARSAEWSQKMPPWSTSELCEFMGIETPNRHTAWGDVGTALEIFRRLRSACGEVFDYERFSLSDRRRGMGESTKETIEEEDGPE